MCRGWQKHFLRSDPLGHELELSTEANSRLLEYDWPGNVRELKNVLSVAAALAAGGKVRSEHLDLPYRPGPAAKPRQGGPAEPGESVPSPHALTEIGYHEQVRNTRRRLVRDALRGADGNRAEAARRLGLTRQALSYLVRKLELDS